MIIDKGNIMTIKQDELLQYDYWSGFSGLEDKEENYSIVTYKLKQSGNNTILILTQEGFASEQAKEHADGGWQMVLDGMKKMIEKN
ncbi:MAG: SRPBCC domain-containing protein [Bacteroidales bacterium]|nr:SRPBCC domain-containing protein [Bacteroidales bacterium]